MLITVMVIVIIKQVLEMIMEVVQGFPVACPDSRVVEVGRPAKSNRRRVRKKIAKERVAGSRQGNRKVKERHTTLALVCLRGEKQTE